MCYTPRPTLTTAHSYVSPSVRTTPSCIVETLNDTRAFQSSLAFVRRRLCRQSSRGRYTSQSPRDGTTSAPLRHVTGTNSNHAILGSEADEPETRAHFGCRLWHACPCSAPYLVERERQESFSSEKVYLVSSLEAWVKRRSLPLCNTHLETRCRCLYPPMIYLSRPNCVLSGKSLTLWETRLQKCDAMIPSLSRAAVHRTPEILNYPRPPPESCQAPRQGSVEALFPPVSTLPGKPRLQPRRTQQTPSY